MRISTNTLNRWLHPRWLHPRWLHPRRIWRGLRSLLVRKPEGQGTQRPGVISLSRTARQVEIQEPIFLGGETARLLVEIVNWSGDVRAALDYVARDTFFSATGDDMEWGISDTLDDGETPIDPDAKVILDRLKCRMNDDIPVLGGLFLQRAAVERLAYGDSFVEFRADFDGISRKELCITRSLYLPVWTVRRVESDRGELLYYEQFNSSYDSTPIQIDKTWVVNFSHNRRNGRGKSLWNNEAIFRWLDYKDQMEDFPPAVRSLIAMNLHAFPKGVEKTEIERQKQKWRQDMSEGAITDTWLPEGWSLGRMSGGNIDAMFKNALRLRHALIPAGFPRWYFQGDETRGARDLFSGPARNYARMRNSWCASLSAGIKRFFEVELILKLGRDRYEEISRQGRIGIEWPVFHLEAPTSPDGNLSTSEANEDEDDRNTAGIGTIRRSRDGQKKFCVFV